VKLVRKHLHPSLKQVARFVCYADERRRFFREVQLKKRQDELIKRYNKDATKLIVFLVPGADRKTGKDTISGGVTSLVSLCEESAKLQGIHGAEVVMCVYPRDFLLLKHENFENSVDVLRFEQLPRYFPKLVSLMIHIPEMFVPHFYSRLFKDEVKWLSQIESVHVNIINANILLMPPPDVIKEFKVIFPKLTITAAHSKYCTPYYRNLYGVPLHKFSAWISPEQYDFVAYKEKENVIVVSPDEHPYREKILQLLHRRGNLEVVVLQNLSYKLFKEIIGKAKWALTFGEGLDGYILEPIFSGTVAFAVYNNDFFTPDFKCANGIYNSYEEMAQRLSQDLTQLDSEIAYPEFQREQYSLCAKHYDFAAYQQNIRLFFEGRYTYP
jgi:hypothetical protein